MEHSPYTPLDSAGGEIRLLVLLPAANIRAPIICTLEKACLHSYPQYEALSYTWGSPGKTHDISLNGVPFAVWENAEAALRRLRHIDRPRRLWIDAICINQLDDTEKAQQLLLMQLIYPRAERVCVWLGESTELSSIGMAKLLSGDLQTHQSMKIISSATMRWGENISIPDPDSSHKVPMVGLASHMDELEWGEVRELLARPWWSRVWIIQEAVLAKNLVLMCGRDSAPWEAVEKALKRQPKAVQAMQIFGIKLDPNDAMERDLNIWNTTIYELLYEFRGQDCTNPRDRIYSFLGLATDSNGIKVVPRYDESTSTAEIYADFARQMIKDTGGLAILNRAREWRGVSKPGPEAFAYSVFNQSSYHDTSARVTYDDGKRVKGGWAALPEGWQRVKRGRSCIYYDWNTNTEHAESPLLSLSSPRALSTKSRRKCPPGWRRSHDNLGRVQLKFDPTSLDPRPTTRGENQKQSDMGPLPSWVPNWACSTHIDPASLLDWSMATPSYQASGLTNVDASYLGAAGDPLTLMGFIFDDISEMAQAWHPLPNIIPVSRHGIAPVEQWETLALRDCMHCPYGGAKGRKEALWRTHIADPAGEAATPSTMSCFVEGWFDHGGWMCDIPSPNDLADVSSNWKQSKARADIATKVPAKWNDQICALMLEAKGPTSSVFKTMKRLAKLVVHGEKKYGAFVRRIHRACAHRRLFVTKKGYMGLAPWNAEVGDTAVSLFGGQTPFLLRPDPAGSNCWKLVGETYVYGIMGGEAMVGSPGLQRFRIY